MTSIPGQDHQLQNLEQLLVALQPSMTEHKACSLRREQSEAPRLSVFSLVNARENMVSNVLAELLRPSGTHGQGSLFLSGFLDLIGASSSIAPDKLGRAIVRREAATGSNPNAPNRRIDIMITLGSIKIAIENKPWAAEQLGQLDAYAGCVGSDGWLVVLAGLRSFEPGSLSDDRLAGLGRRFVIVPYSSSPADEAAQDEAAQTDNKWHSYWTKRSLAQWLADSAKQCEAPRAGMLAAELGRYCDLVAGNERVSEMDELSGEIFKLIKDNRGWLEAASEFGKRWDTIKYKIVDSAFNKVCERIEVFLGSDFGSFEFSREMSGNFAQFFMRKKDWPKEWLAGIESQSPNWRCVIMGVFAPSKGMDSNLRDKISQSCRNIYDNGNGKSNDKWAYFVNLPRCLYENMLATEALLYVAGLSPVEDNVFFAEWLARHMCNMARAVDDEMKRWTADGKAITA